MFNVVTEKVLNNIDSGEIDPSDDVLFIWKRYEFFRVLE